jgi:hypothetical protein
MNARSMLYHFGVSLLMVWLVHIMIVTVVMLLGVVRASWFETVLLMSPAH